jgi:hypothetical protein
MKKYFLLMLALAFMACEETIFVGGTVIDSSTGDSIAGIEMGLFVFKPSSSGYSEKKWSELELIASATSNSDGFFSVEIDEDFNMGGTIFLPLLPTDTLLVNSQYAPRFSLGLQYAQYDTNGEFELFRSSHILFVLNNFTQEKILVRCGDIDALNPSLTHSLYLIFKGLLTGKQHKFDFYEVVNDDYENPKYLGSTSKYIKTQLPAEPEKVFWEMSIQEIEIDYNTLEK